MTQVHIFPEMSFSGLAKRMLEQSPETVLRELSRSAKHDVLSTAFARYLDEKDEMRQLKKEFVFPTYVSEGKEKKYICLSGNILGLQPKSAKPLVTAVLNSWANKGVECHFVDPLPAASCEKYVSQQLGKLVGAKSEEVVAMNTVDVDLHLMLVSFYQPTTKRHKILFDSESDYVNIAKSQIVSHGFKVSESLVSAPYQDTSFCLDMDDLIDFIEQNGESIATILLPAILRKSGQFLDIERITRTGHKKGCMVGLVLNDAVGNVDLKLNEWGVDFACWDTGRYINAGSSSMGCTFLHEKHSKNHFPKFTGWWSHRMSTRFEMTNELDRTPGVNGYKLSNLPPTKIAQIKAGLDIFGKISIEKIREKSILLNGYLETLLRLKYKCTEGCMDSDPIRMITPSNPSERGAQLSFKVKEDAKDIYEKLKKRGIICSFYSLDVLTVCPAPLYCGFQDVLLFVNALSEICEL
uniref:kynureninase-like n=1 Tax=Styela clava TaxID=7725 RepID=UPI00193A0206|nr:kynureninase-like [Styela clava]